MIQSELVATAPAAPRLDVFGFKLTPMVRDDFLDLVSWHIETRRRVLMTHLNLHGMAMLYESPVMARLMARDETLVTIDGMSLVWLSRMAGYRVRRRMRATSLDYIDRLFERAIANGWNVAWVGGSQETLEKGLAHFRRHHPGLTIQGYTGYFDMHDHAAAGVQARILADIAASRADLLLVGMGMPRQEEWVEAVRDRIDVPVIITMGAMLEYFAGTLPMPPRWLEPIGLEWMFRLVTSPRRVAFRYLVEPFILLSRMMRGRRPASAQPAPDGAIAR